MPRRNEMFVRGTIAAEIAIALVLAAAICVPDLQLTATAPDALIIRHFGDDDAYYYFGVARNVAAGIGSSFDGVTVTNGYHPLWMWVCAGLAAVTDGAPLGLLRGALVVSSLLVAATVLFMFLALRELGVGVAARIVGLAPFVLTPTPARLTNGSELALNLSLASLLVWLLSRMLRLGAVPGTRSFAVFGGLSVLLFLARVDNLLLIAPATIAAASILRLQMDSRSKWRSFALTVGPLSLAVAVYVLVSYSMFRTVLPVSGQVKQFWAAIGGSVLGPYPSSLSAALVNYLSFRATGVLNGPVADVLPYAGFHQPYGLPVAIATAVVAGSVLLAAKPTRLLVAVLCTAATLKALALLLPGYVQARHWYWTAEYLGLMLTTSAGLHALIQIRPLRRWSTRLQWATVALAIVILTPPYVSATVERFNVERRDGSEYLHERVSFVEDHTPSTALVGTPNAGGLGYLSTRRRFVNIDGLINSYPFFDSMRRGTSGACLRQIGVTHILIPPGYLLHEPYKHMLAGRVRLVAAWREESGAERHDLYEFRDEQVPGSSVVSCDRTARALLR